MRIARTCATPGCGAVVGSLHFNALCRACEKAKRRPRDLAYQDTRPRFEAGYSDASWRKVRAEALDRARHRCERCQGEGPLDVHHLVPLSQGGEHRLDLVEVLCRPCHAKADADRRRSDRIPSSW